MFETTEYELGTIEASKMIRKFTGHVFLWARTDLPTTDGKCFRSMGKPIKVSKVTAIDFISDTLKNFETRGARIKLSMSDTCLFIG